MASHHEGSNGHDDKAARADDARNALEALSADRRALADRVKSPPWYYPLLGVATALLIGSPGARDSSSQSMMVAFGCVGLVFVTLAYEKKTGVTTSRTAMPRSLGIAVAIGVIIVLLLPVSFALAATGHPGWILVTAAAAFVTMWIGGRIYDRAYDQELRRER